MKSCRVDPAVDKKGFVCSASPGSWCSGAFPPTPANPRLKIHWGCDIIGDEATETPSGKFPVRKERGMEICSCSCGRVSAVGFSSLLHSQAEVQIKTRNLAASDQKYSPKLEIANIPWCGESPTVISWLLPGCWPGNGFSISPFFWQIWEASIAFLVK